VTKAVPRVVLDTNVVLPIAEQEELLADWLPWVEVVQIPDTPPPVPHCRDLLTLAGTPGLCPALGIAEFCHRYLAATLSNQCPPNAQHFSIASQLSYRWRAMPPRRRTSTAASPPRSLGGHRRVRCGHGARRGGAGRLSRERSLAFCERCAICDDLHRQLPRDARKRGGARVGIAAVLKWLGTLRAMLMQPHNPP
jgi:hypothetical protein